MKELPFVIDQLYYINMTKTLAAIAVILVSIAMAFGIKSVADRNKASSTMTPSARSGQEITNNQETNKMELEIISPGGVVNNKNVTLKGATVPKAEVQVDDQELEADENGEFETKLDLDEGENEIVVTANDDSGESVVKSVKVTYEPAE